MREQFVTPRIEYMRQHHDCTCWAACVYMIIRWRRGVDSHFARNCSDESQIAKIIKGQCTTAYDEEIVNALEHYNVRARLLKQPLNENQIMTEINSNRPFIICFDWERAGGHAVVSEGYRSLYDVDQHNFRLYLLDPNIRMGRQFPRYNDLVEGTYNDRLLGNWVSTIILI